jgi:hypothetical protein
MFQEKVSHPIKFCSFQKIQFFSSQEKLNKCLQQQDTETMTEERADRRPHEPNGNMDNTNGFMLTATEASSHDAATLDFHSNDLSHLAGSHELLSPNALDGNALLEEQQKFLIQALQLASSSAAAVAAVQSQFNTPEKRKELIDSILPTLEALKPAIRTSLSPEEDDRILKRRFRSAKNKALVADTRNTFVKGPFSKFEKVQVEAAIQEYLQEKGIPEPELYYLIHRKTPIIPTAGQGADSAMPLKNPYSAPEYNGFIGQVLERSKVNRSLDQLYWYMSRAYSVVRTEKKRWTPEEDERLKFLVQLKGRKWSEIEKEIGKTDAKVYQFTYFF